MLQAVCNLFGMNRQMMMIVVVSKCCCEQADEKVEGRSASHTVFSMLVQQVGELVGMMLE